MDASSLNKMVPSFMKSDQVASDGNRADLMADRAKESPEESDVKGDVFFEGFLEKKGGGTSTLGRRQWNRRWFQIRGLMVSYYKNKNVAKPSGEIRLDGCRIDVSEESTDKGHYEITIREQHGREFRARANSRGEINEFKAAIEKAIAASSR